MTEVFTRPVSHLEKIGANLLWVVLQHKDDKAPSLGLISDVYHALGWSAEVSRGSLQQSKDKPEPSVEEILDSIRSCIHEGD